MRYVLAVLVGVLAVFGVRTYRLQSKLNELNETAERKKFYQQRAKQAAMEKANREREEALLRAQSRRDHFE